MIKKKTILQQIRDVVVAWKREDIEELAAMDTIDGILVDAGKIEHRLKVISEDARRDREASGL